MPRVGLSSVRIDRIKVERTTIFHDKLIKGFALRVTPAGARTLMFIYKRPRTGRQVKLRLGSWSPDGFKLHRARAGEMRALLDRGIDPREHEAAERESDRIFFEAALRGTEPLQDLFREFIQSRRDLRRTERTISDYEYIFNRYVRPVLGRHSVNAISRSEVADLHRRMAGNPVPANRVLALLHTVFEFAIERELRHDNPCRSIRRHAERPRTRYLDDDELRRLLATLDDSPAGRCLRLMALTGMRGCEVRGLRWEEVDLGRRVVRLPRTKTGKPREVPLSSPAAALLRRMGGGEGLVFPGARSGEALSHSTLHNAWRRVREAAGVPDARPHDLRHAFATRAVEAGLSLPAAMLTTGHASTGAFMRYFEPNQRAARAAADAVERRYEAVLQPAAGSRHVRHRTAAARSRG
jgi:integrase